MLWELLLKKKKLFQAEKIFFFSGNRMAVVMASTASEARELNLFGPKAVEKVILYPVS